MLSKNSPLPLGSTAITQGPYLHPQLKADVILSTTMEQSKPTREARLKILSAQILIQEHRI